MTGQPTIVSILIQMLYNEIRMEEIIMQRFLYVKRIAVFVAALLTGLCSVGTYVCFAEATITERYCTMDIGYQEDIGTSSGTLYFSTQLDSWSEDSDVVGFSYEYSCNKAVAVDDIYDRSTQTGLDGYIDAKRGETVSFSYSGEDVYVLHGDVSNVYIQTKVSYNLYDDKDEAFYFKEASSGSFELTIPDHPKGDTICIQNKYYYTLDGTDYYVDGYSFGIVITDYDGSAEVFTDAQTDPGEDGGIPLPLAIVGGIGAVVAGVAGAVASTLGSTENGAKDTPSQYIMKVYKEFGDTIVEGDRVNVYAHIVTITEEGEKEVPELTRNIRITCSDGVFDVDCQSALAGSYKGAWVSVAAGNEAAEGCIDFVFTGAGGTFTNHVKFNVIKREIILYQNNIALPALDEEGGYVGFTVTGMDPEKCEIEVEMSENSSYAVDYVESENVPGTYFAVLADINTKPGEQGTYSEQTLYFRATDGEHEAENFMPVYRVTTGLCIGAETINCYRKIKKEALSKEVQNLEASDFKIAHTEIAVMYLEYDKENKSMFYRPVEAAISFEPIDEQKENKVVLDRIEGIGLEAVLKASENSVSIYDVACTKGWLEPPTRTMAQIVVTADEEDEDGQPVHLEAKKEVLLQSQPLRERAIKTSEDERIEQWIIDFRSQIYDMNLAIRAMDISDLGGELAMLDLLEDGYDEHYGYDPILIAQIQYNVQKYIHDVQMNELQKRQRVLEDYQAAANADANSTAMIWAHSFKMISDKYLDNWGGMVVRMGLGFFTSGASEVVFVAMDANKAVVNYYDRTPLSARNGVDAFIAGYIPVVVNVGITAGTMLVGAMIPEEVKESAKNWVVAKTGALMTPRVQNAIFAFKDIKNRFVKKLASLKTLTYDPKSKCLLIREAASNIDNVVAAGRSKALVSVSNTSRIPRTEEGKLISSLSKACNKRGSEQAGKFIKAVKSGNKAEIEAAYWGIRKDPMNSFAINKMNVAGKTKDQILAGTKVASRARAVYNEMDDVLLQKPAERIVKREAAAAGLAREEEIVLFKGTGHTAADGTKGFKIGADTDVQLKVMQANGGLKDVPIEMNNRFLRKGYCESAGLPCGTAAEGEAGLKVINVEHIHAGHPESYAELPKVLSGKAVSTDSSLKNINTRVHKLISGVEKGRGELQSVVADKPKFKNIMSESAKYADGKIGFEALSKETKEAMGSLKKIRDALHQPNKTLNLDLGKDFKAQALGHKGTFTEANVEFAQKCEFTEYLPDFDEGLFFDELTAKGTSYEAEAMSMIMNAHEVNELCKGVSGATVSNLFSRTQNAVVGGVTGAINSGTTNNGVE